jgi:tetratricopeptide (TPR) repeat protein
MTPLKARILLADDHAIVRHGLRLLLDEEPDLEVAAEASDGAEAVQLALAEDFDRVPMAAVWSGAFYGWAEVCSELGLVDRAGELYELLAPFAGQVASGGSQLYGSFAWPLGRLAVTLGRFEQAEEHFAAAAQIDERLGAPLFLARTNADWANALISRGRPEDLDRVEPMLEQAERAARRAGAVHIVAKVSGLRT